MRLPEIKRGLQFKMLGLVLSIMAIGFSFLIYKAIKEQEKSLLEERKKMNETLSYSILSTIYKDMLDERADMARYVIENLKTLKGVERLQIIRSNGLEEAFQDLKTLEEVEREYGELKKEWKVNHPNKPNNVAAGVEIVEFKGALKRFNEGEENAIYYFEKGSRKELFTYLVPIKEKAKCLACHEEGKGRGVLMVSTSLDEMKNIVAASRNKWILYGLLTIVGTGIFLSVVTKGIIIRPVDQTVTMLKEIASGKGNLRKRLKEYSKDEIGELARWFNSFVEGMQAMVKEIHQSSTEVNATSENITEISQRVQNLAEQQLRSTEETSSSILEMDSSIRTVVESTDSLLASTERVSSSVIEMSSTTEEIAREAGFLSDLVDSPTSFIKRIVDSIRDIASSIDLLAQRTEEVVSSITEIGNVISEVAGHTKDQAALSEKVKTEAIGLGMEAVSKTKDWMEEIKEEVNTASNVINKLGEKSGEIGNVVNVIEEVTKDINLLALNAAILAAQAGEHGKGFAVVADEIKDLSDRTAISTKEIAGIIKPIQEEAVMAVNSMRNSAIKVEEGVRLSKDAHNALIKILENANKSLDMAKRIKIATEEQSKGANQAKEAIYNINEMIAEIKKSADEQSRAIEEIIKATEHMKDIARKVKISTDEQAGESKDIAEIVLEMTDGIRSIANSMLEQRSASERVVKAIEMIKDTAQGNVRLSSDLDNAFNSLSKQARSLKGRIDNFEV